MPFDPAAYIAACNAVPLASILRGCGCYGAGQTAVTSDPHLRAVGRLQELLYQTCATYLNPPKPPASGPPGARLTPPPVDLDQLQARQGRVYFQWVADFLIRERGVLGDAYLAACKIMRLGGWAPHINPTPHRHREGFESAVNAGPGLLAQWLQDHFD